jgi:hypothetical protein
VLESNTYTVPAGAYGPYNASSFTGYGTGVLAAGSAPASGTIAAGETRTIIYVYAKTNQPPATITVMQVDDTTWAILKQDTFTLPVGDYGPYNASSFAGYGAGVLAAGSEPASGTIAAGEAKTITYRYTAATVIDPNITGVVDGRILTPDMTGDTSDWVEIARNGNYSLIVRKNFISTYPSYKGDPDWQYTNFSTTNNYRNSTLRNKINAWFNGTASGTADKLPADARLRSFTMQNDSPDVRGTCNSVDSLANGFSKPGASQAKTGDDIAFALSYSEAANYCSKTHFVRAKNPETQESNSIAVANFNKLSIPSGDACAMWLRSPGDVSDTAGTVGNDGRVFQFFVQAFPAGQRGYTYPALWVDSAIF